MRHILSLIHNTGFYFITFVLAFAAMLGSFLPSSEPVRLIFRLWTRVCKAWALFVLRGSFEVRGREHMPKGGPVILACKHQSEFDTLMIGNLFPNLAAVAMKELDKLPFFGRIISKLGHIKVSVSAGKKNQLPQVIEGARQVIAEGRPFAIFPEGTLMAVGRKERYRSGIYHIYRELGIAVHPIAQDTGMIWPTRKWTKNVGQKSAFEFLEPIQPGLDKETFMYELEHRIETATNALIREHADPETLRTIVFDYEEDGPRWPRPKSPEKPLTAAAGR